MEPTRKSNENRWCSKIPGSGERNVFLLLVSFTRQNGYDRHTKNCQDESCHPTAGTRSGCWERETSARLVVEWKRFIIKLVDEEIVKRNKTFRYLFDDSVHLVLGALYRLRSAPSLRPHPQIQNDDRRCNIYSEFGTPQFGCQSAHLLPIFNTPL